MSYNPYSQDSSIDDDIFDTSHGSHRHTFGNKPCRKHGCGITHDVRLKDGVEMPPEVQEELSRLLDSVPKDIVDRAVIIAEPEDAIDSYAASKGAFLKFAHIVRAMNSQAPMLVAMFEVLDSMTEGAVTRRYISYAAENSLININVIKKTLCTFREWLKTSDVDPAPDEDTFRAIDDIEIYLDKRIDHYVEQYVQACIDTDMPIDQSVIDTGEPSADRLIPREFLLNGLHKEMAILFEGRLVQDLNHSDFDFEKKMDS